MRQKQIKAYMKNSARIDNVVAKYEESLGVDLTWMDRDVLVGHIRHVYFEGLIVTYHQ